MKRQVLGLDINDEFVAAAVLRQNGQDRQITAFGVKRFHDREDLAEALLQLVEQIGWKEGPCYCGIPVSGISLRNITIPFTDRKKIVQVLPMELEDQLLRPVGDQLVEFMVTGGDEEESHILVTALSKNALQQHLDLLRGAGLSPEVITLRTVPISEQFQRESKQDEGFILVDAGLHSVNLAIVSHGKVIFVRRLPYTDRMFTAHPFIFDDEGPGIADHEVAMECIGALCSDIRRSLGLFQLESGSDSLPERIIMSGCMVRLAFFREKVGAELGREVLPGDLRLQAGVALDKDAAGEWDPGTCDHALALALQGLRKKATVNFRKDEFAPTKLLLASKQQLLAASVLLVLLLGGFAAYLGFGYRSLNARYGELGAGMEKLFRETFPEVTRVVDPLIEMKTKLRDVQGPAVATPIFSGDKRALNILADISERIPGEVEIHVSRLVIDDEAVMIKGTTDTYNNVNLIQGVLRKSPEYVDVAIVSAAAEKESGQVRFELKLRMAGTS